MGVELLKEPRGSSCPAHPRFPVFLTERLFHLYNAAPFEVGWLLIRVSCLLKMAQEQLLRECFTDDPPIALVLSE
jgi:hypothetical protein